MMRKLVALIVSGAVLCVAGLLVSLWQEDGIAPIDNDHLIIALAGEGFDHVCSPDIKATFDDDGLIELEFESEDGEDVVWMMAISKAVFDWESYGDVTRYDGDGNPTDDVKGEQEFESLFRIAVGSGERIVIHESEPVDETPFRVNVHTPLIAAVPYDDTNLEDNLNDYLDLMYESSEEEATALASEITSRFFSVGRVKDVELSMAMPYITMSYADTAAYRSRYTFLATPGGYSDHFATLSWEGFMQAYPSIEYQKEGAMRVARVAVNFLYVIGFFLITSAIVEGVSSKRDVAKR